MNLSNDFDAATLRSKSFMSRPSNEDLLDLYGFYKQATEGDNIGSRPTGFDFKAIAKHDAWESKKGSSKEKAMESYIALVARLAKDNGVS